MHTFLGQNVLIFPLYILLTRRINSIWVLINFGLEVLGHFEAQKVIQEKSTKFPMIFELY